MTEDEVIDIISEALYTWEEEYGLDTDDPDDKISIRTYDEVGMLTNNSGLVLSIGDSKFQITVVEV